MHASLYLDIQNFPHSLTAQGVRRSVQAIDFPHSFVQKKSGLVIQVPSFYATQNLSVNTVRALWKESWALSLRGISLGGPATHHQGTGCYMPLGLSFCICKMGTRTPILLEGEHLSVCLPSFSCKGTIFITHGMLHLISIESSQRTP